MAKTVHKSLQGIQIKLKLDEREAVFVGEYSDTNYVHVRFSRVFFEEDSKRRMPRAVSRKIGEVVQTDIMLKRTEASALYRLLSHYLSDSEKAGG